MKRLSQARFLTGSWKSLGLTAGLSLILCVGVSTAVVSYVEARAEGRNLYAGPTPVVAGEGTSLFPLLEESWAPCSNTVVTTSCEDESRNGGTPADGLLLVPAVVCAESGPTALEPSCEAKPVEILVSSPAETVSEVARRSPAKSSARPVSRATSKSTALKKSSSKSSRTTRKKRRRRVSLQGAVVGVQIGAAVKTASSRPTSVSPVHYERPTRVNGPAKGGIGMN